MPSFSSLELKLKRRAEPLSSQAEVREELRFEYGCHLRNALDFDDDSILDDQIHSVVGEQMSLVVSGNPGLPLKVDLPLFELDTNCRLVDRLEQSRSENSVHFDRRTDDSSRQRL